MILEFNFNGCSAKIYWDRKYQRRKGCGKNSGMNFRTGRCFSSCLTHSSHFQVRKQSEIK